MASNSTFFNVVPIPALEQVGWQVKVYDYQDFTTVVAIINEFYELMVNTEMSDVGAGSITLDADSHFWNSKLASGSSARTLLDHEYLWVAFEDGERRHEFLGSKVKESLLDDGETRGITVSGPGAAEVLKWGIVLRPGFPAPPQKNRPLAEPTAGLVWQFPASWSAMKVWLTLFNACQERGTIPWVTPMFNATTDSGGEPWEIVQTPQTTVTSYRYQPAPGTDMFDLLAKHTGQDLNEQFAMRADWFMHPGFKLDVRKQIGVHREKYVIFPEGVLTSKTRSRSRDEIANYIIVQDDVGGTSLASDSTSIAKWNRREQLQSAGVNITVPARRNAVADVFLQQRKDEVSEWTIQVPYDALGRRVYRDFNIGDFIGIGSLDPDLNSLVDVYRVLAITVSVRDATPTLELTLQSKYELLQRTLKQQLTSLLHQINTVVPLPGRDFPIPIATTPIGIDPDGRWTLMPETGFGGSGEGGGGVRVFIQDDDPGDEARPGDFWYDTTYTPSSEEFPYDSDATYEPPPPTPGEQHMEFEGQPITPPDTEIVYYEPVDEGE